MFRGLWSFYVNSGDTVQKPSECRPAELTTRLPTKTVVWLYHCRLISCKSHSRASLLAMHPIFKKPDGFVFI